MKRLPLSPAEISEALEWAAIARQRELAAGSGFVATDALEADQIWTTISRLSGAIRRSPSLQSLLAVETTPAS